MGMILRIASSRIVGQGDIVGRSGYFSLNLSANSVMRGRLDARRTLKSLVADLRITFWIGKEGATIVSMKGYVNDEAGYETMELMEDSVLYVLKRKKLQELFLEDLHIANWGRRYAEMELLETEQRLISMLSAIASERYRQLVEMDPELLQRLPLGSIASYLGITQTSLSRIRSRMK